LSVNRTSCLRRYRRVRHKPISTLSQRRSFRSSSIFARSDSDSAVAEQGPTFTYWLAPDATPGATLGAAMPVVLGVSEVPVPVRLQPAIPVARSAIAVIKTRVDFIAYSPNDGRKIRAAIDVPLRSVWRSRASAERLPPLYRLRSLGRIFELGRWQDPAVQLRRLTSRRSGAAEKDRSWSS
jgi:hypothetical protein